VSIYEQESLVQTLVVANRGFEFPPARSKEQGRSLGKIHRYVKALSQKILLFRIMEVPSTVNMLISSGVASDEGWFTQRHLGFTEMAPTLDPRVACCGGNFFASHFSSSSGLYLKGPKPPLYAIRPVSSTTYIRSGHAEYRFSARLAMSSTNIGIGT
jgi:hypothetical protein